MSGEPQRPIQLLFVDDDTSYMAVAQHLLNRYQPERFTILWRQDGPSAIELLERPHAIDLILIDYYIPEMDGLEVTRQIRKRQIEVPIIFLTTTRDFRIAVEAMKLGVEDYLVKDEAVDSVLPRTILNILDRVALKRRLAEQQRSELIARRRTEAIRELVVTICHEFNNPLAAIKLSNDILRRQNLPPEEAAIVEQLGQDITAVEKEIIRLRDINFEPPP